jgi:hypothetical protein
VFPDLPKFLPIVKIFDSGVAESVPKMLYESVPKMLYESVPKMLYESVPKMLYESVPISTNSINIECTVMFDNLGVCSYL